MCFTWRGDSVLIGGFVATEREQQRLDGPDENPGQAQVEDHVEQDDFNCVGGRHLSVKKVQ